MLRKKKDNKNYVGEHQNSKQWEIRKVNAGRAKQTKPPQSSTKPAAYRPRKDQAGEIHQRKYEHN